MRLPGRRRRAQRDRTPETEGEAEGTAASDASEILWDEDAPLLEFPEPEAVASRRRRRRGLTLLLAAVAGLLVITATLHFSPLLTIHEVQLERNELLTDERAQELLQPVYGTPLPQVGNAQVEELLAEETVVDDVIVQGELPDTLRVEIVEQPPVAEVHDGDEIIFFNEEGERIRVFEDWEAPDAEGYATPEISSEAALQNQAVFRAIVSSLGELPPEARESMDSATADSIDSVSLLLEDGRTIVWGSEERGPEKAAVLERILASEAADFTEAETIDLSTPEAPVTR